MRSDFFRWSASLILGVTFELLLSTNQREGLMWSFPHWYCVVAVIVHTEHTLSHTFIMQLATDIIRTSCQTWLCRQSQNNTHNPAKSHWRRQTGKHKWTDTQTNTLRPKTTVLEKKKKESRKHKKCTTNFKEKKKKRNQRGFLRRVQSRGVASSNTDSPSRADRLRSGWGEVAGWVGGWSGWLGVELGLSMKGTLLDYAYS